MAAAHVVHIPAQAPPLPFELGAGITADVASAAERSRLSSSAMRGFLVIADRWELTEAQRRALLGGIAPSTFHGWRTNLESIKLNHDTLTRISLVLGMYKALQLSFGKPWADRWVTLRNRGPLFGGETPVSYMTRHGLPGMVEVRRLLDSWRSA